jgi:hypothetical protein
MHRIKQAVYFKNKPHLFQHIQIKIFQIVSGGCQMVVKSEEIYLGVYPESCFFVIERQLY